jgi:hypothetical protein
MVPVRPHGDNRVRTHITLTTPAPLLAALDAAGHGRLDLALRTEGIALVSSLSIDVNRRLSLRRMSMSRQRLNQRRRAGGLGFTEARGLGRRTVPSRLSPDSRSRRADRRRPAQSRRRSDARPDWRTRIRSRDATCCGRRTAWPCRCYAAAWLTPLTSARLVSRKRCVIHPAVYAAFYDFSRDRAALSNSFAV